MSNKLHYVFQPEIRQFTSKEEPATIGGIIISSNDIFYHKSNLYPTSEFKSLERTIDYYFRDYIKHTFIRINYE